MSFFASHIQPFKRALCFLIFTAFCTLDIFAQESVLKLFDNDLKQADTYFQQGDYYSALEKYQEVAVKSRPLEGLYSKIARCYFHLNKYDQTVTSYRSALLSNHRLLPQDLYYYASSLSSLGRYQEAIEYYKKSLDEFPQKDLVMRKIWRLENIRFLYEDSIHYTIRKIPLSTNFGEFAAVPWKSGLVFVSNQPRVGWLSKIDGATNAHFYRLFYSDIISDPLRIQSDSYGPLRSFSKSLAGSFHIGPVAFYENQQKMVFSRTEKEGNGSGSRNLHLYFASKKGDKWVVDASFPHNGSGFSNTDPTISEDGRSLYFSSDRPEGYGGKDLYRSELINGKWTEPVNLGDYINTTMDEVSPFLQNDQVLYFSSNGLPGFGGLDIFKVDLQQGSFSEVENPGYPINSGYDDFGIYIDSVNSHGYFSSNRENGGYDDDIYEFDMDLQPYPVEVNGLVKYIEDSWKDSTKLKVLPNANLFLIDEVKGVIIEKTVSDSKGNFSLTIPYFSKYKVRITRGDLDGIVTFEVPKYTKLKGTYDIVVVKDDFKTAQNNLKE